MIEAAQDGRVQGRRSGSIIARRLACPVLSDVLHPGHLTAHHGANRRATSEEKVNDSQPVFDVSMGKLKAVHVQKNKCGHGVVFWA